MMINSNGPTGLIKEFFKDSVSFLASVLVLVAGSYYLAATYFTEAVTSFAAVIYFISAVSFSVLTFVALGYVSSDAYKLCRKLRSKRVRIFVWVIILFNMVGYVGTIAVSAANVNQAAKLVMIPDVYRKANLPPEIPKDLTWGQLVELYIKMGDSLGQCNADKKEILKRIDAR